MNEKNEPIPDEIRAVMSRMIRLLIAALLCGFAAGQGLTASKGVSFGGMTGDGQYIDSSGNPTDHPPEYVSMTLRVSPSFYLAILLILIVVLVFARRAGNARAADSAMRRGAAALVVFTVVVILGGQLWFSRLQLVESDIGTQRTLTVPFVVAEIVGGKSTSVGNEGSLGDADVEVTGDPGGAEGGGLDSGGREGTDAAGALDLQRGILEDGVVTESEYVEAVEAARQCMIDAGAEVSEATWDGLQLAYTVTGDGEELGDSPAGESVWEERRYSCEWRYKDEVEHAWLQQGEVVEQ
ncbi:MAG: hypothetical protein QM705_14505 [Ancrocorticia sp.]